MTHLLTLLLLPALAACGLDKLENPEAKSDFQVMMEERAELAANAPAVVPVVASPATTAIEVAAPARVVLAAPQPLAFVAPVVPVATPDPPVLDCFEVFRISRCVANASVPWFWGDAL